MTAISIRDLKPTGSALFADAESYLTDLSNDSAASVSGGLSTSIMSLPTTIFTDSPWCVPDYTIYPVTLPVPGSVVTVPGRAN